MRQLALEIVVALSQWFSNFF